METSQRGRAESRPPQEFKRCLIAGHTVTGAVQQPEVDHGIRVVVVVIALVGVLLITACGAGTGGLVRDGTMSAVACFRVKVWEKVAVDDFAPLVIENCNEKVQVQP